MYSPQVEQQDTHRNVGIKINFLYDAVAFPGFLDKARQNSKMYPRCLPLSLVPSLGVWARLASTTGFHPSDEVNLWCGTGEGVLQMCLLS